jgi:hypothetical protein
VDAILERARELKLELIDFVLAAEGELATALEAYSAKRLAQLPQAPGSRSTNWIIDLFLTEGRVGRQTPLQLFIESQPDLSEGDRHLVQNWHRSFVGLFAVTQALADGFEVMNWMTAKHYQVKPNGLQSQDQLNRLKPGEILIAQITPVSDEYWMFTGSLTLLGKLGKPKLAVAIGNFKDQYSTYRYGDAPELLEEAWRSVEQYYQEFLDFFGTDELILPGYQLDKKIAEFQEFITQKRLDAAGIDSSKSLSELAEESGISQTELAAAAAEMGADEKSIEHLLNHQQTKMIAPSIQLPDSLKKSDTVTVIAHPRWGQLILTQYESLKQILETASWNDESSKSQLFLSLLKDQSISSYLWYHLANEYPVSLEKALQDILNRPSFTLQSDLDDLLLEFGKPTEPDLPAIASVPIHLHNLFQDAFLEVNKSKSKAKVKRKTAIGFQR